MPGNRVVPAKRLRDLTDLQLAFLDTIWEHGEMSARELHERLERKTGLARKSVGTILHRLERDGVLTYRMEGREYLYRTAVTREQVQKARVKGLVSTLFKGDFPALVSFALDRGDVAEGDIARLREMLEKWPEDET